MVTVVKSDAKEVVLDRIAQWGTRSELLEQHLNQPLWRHIGIGPFFTFNRQTIAREVAETLHFGDESFSDRLRPWSKVKDFVQAAERIQLHKDVSVCIGSNIDAQQLDKLFDAIGWKPRGIDKWQEVLSKTSSAFSVWHNDELIGFGRIMEDGVMCMMYDIGVHPKYQGYGIGTLIMEKLINEVKDKSYASIGLFAWEENPANIPFYEKCGFVRQKTGMELVKYMRRE